MSRPPLNGTRLSTVKLVTTLVERSAPDPHRPRCAPDREARLAHIEQASAACYAQSEFLATRMRNLASTIDKWGGSEKDPDCPAVSANPVLSILDDTEFDDNDSVVVHIDNLRTATKID